MFNDLHSNFHENVLVAYGNFLDSQSQMSAGRWNDLKLAINAATALYHFREHFPKEQKKTRADIALHCPDYDLVGDIANASKHNRLTRGQPLIRNIDDVYEQITCTLYHDDEGDYRNVEKQVMVRLKSGVERNVLEVATNVVNMWSEVLFQLSIVNKQRKFTIRERSQPIGRRDSRDQLTLNFTRGVAATQRFKLQEYNYNTNSIDPVDLTNSRPVFSIYQNLYTAVLEGKDEKKGETVVFEAKMTEKQRREFEQLSPEEKFNSFFELALEQGINSGELIMADGTKSKVTFSRADESRFK
jgi:hypothetical protein